MLEEQLFRTFFCPALVCAAVLALVGRPWRREAVSKEAAAIGAALATVSGYTVGHGLIVGWSFFAPLERRDWLPCVGMVIAALVVAEQVRPLRRLWFRWGLRLVATSLAVWLVVGPLTELAPATAALATTGLWIAVDSLFRRRAGVSPALTSLIAVAAASGVLVLSGSASFGQLTGVLAACVTMLTVMAWRHPGRTCLHGAAGMMTVLPAVLWLNLQRTSFIDVSVASALLVAAAMVSPWVGEVAAVRRLRPWPRSSVCVLAALLPAVLALLLAWSASEPPGDYDY